MCRCSSLCKCIWVLIFCKYASIMVSNSRRASLSSGKCNTCETTIWKLKRSEYIKFWVAQIDGRRVFKLLDNRCVRKFLDATVYSSDRLEGKYFAILVSSNVERSGNASLLFLSYKWTYLAAIDIAEVLYDYQALEALYQSCSRYFLLVLRLLLYILHFIAIDQSKAWNNASIMLARKVGDSRYFPNTLRRIYSTFEEMISMRYRQVFHINIHTVPQHAAQTLRLCEWLETFRNSIWIGPQTWTT